MSKRTMCIFGAGVLAVIVVAGTAGAGWLLINERTRYLLLVVLMAWGALILGIVLAMAIVGAMLLYKLTWRVDVTPRTPQVVVHGAPMSQMPQYPMLPPAPVQEPPPVVWRPTRKWQVLGTEAQWAPPRIEDGDE